MRARSHKYPDDSSIYTDTTYYHETDQYFDLGWQRLKKLSYHNEFSYLKNLFIDHNELNSLPDSSYLPHLEQITCAYNNLTNVPFYPKLNFLNISNNRIASCRSYANSRLVYLDASFNPGLNIDIPLPNCKHLYINDNEINKIDLNLFPRIEFLDCGNNQISEIGYSDTLIELNISSNSITNLPPFPKLLRLMADSNSVGYLRTYPNMIFISISNNKLSRIDSQPVLKKIIANNNQISHLGKMPELELIDYSHNSITNIDLPETIEYVSLHFNPISDINLNENVLRSIKELQINFNTYTNIYSKYYSYFDAVNVSVNRDKLFDLLKRLNKVFNEEIIELIFSKLSNLEFQDRVETIFKIALKLYWNYFSSEKNVKNIDDLIKTEQFKYLHSSIEKIYYKTIIITLYFNDYY